MTRDLLRRLVATVPVVLGAATFVFFMLHLVPGDPVDLMFMHSPLTVEDKERVRHQLGLDQPLVVQYVQFLGRAATGDLGHSIRSQRPVIEEITNRLPRTLELAVAGVLVGLLLGLTFGVLAAVKQGTWLDTLTIVSATLGVSMPSFWLGLMLIFLFALNLGWLPASGADTWGSLVLPAFALGLAVSAIIARMTRSSLLEVLRLEYITAARAKGLSEPIIVGQHALKNALIPVVTIVGLQFGNLLGGAFVIETVFAWPGVGQLAVQALMSRDYPLVQGIVLMVSVIFVVINLGIDMLYRVLDPRISYQ
ncbi:MAG: ABC transporter permease [Chloroflexi bacterium]|nr:ABC transporter permease [Chloroflexota bacterium]